MFTLSGPTSRRDGLLHIEKQMQQIWEEEKIFESTPNPGQEKYFITFPYPYMNGKLHLGHVFSYTKADFEAGYQRLKGKNVLMPFGFHLTGMPIKGAADKLRIEMEEFGNPPVFPEVEEEVAASGKQFASARAKLTAKFGTSKYQWQIMKKLGFSDEEIPAFADERHWLRYFPPHAMEDLRRFGAHIDWRRSFVTTEQNPYYDSFIRWQFEILRREGKITFGGRPTIYSPGDGQPSADHDRSVGEGVLPQNYTLIKMRLMDMPDELAELSAEDAGRVFMMCATLRPETMYGQTNCWILPKGEYGVYRMKNGEIWVMSPRAAMNCAFQAKTAVEGKLDQVASVVGTSFIGKRCVAPFAGRIEEGVVDDEESAYKGLMSYSNDHTANGVVYILPMKTISMNKGTGVVTSVPSDAPADYISYMDIVRNMKKYAKHGVTPEMVALRPVSIISTEKYGLEAARIICQDLKIKNPEQAAKLEAAKDLAYNEGFHKGTMVVGHFAGEPVEEAKNKVKAMLIDMDLAIDYYEPDNTVVSRSGSECVVKMCDQWMFSYGEENWKQDVVDQINRMELYTSDIRRLANQKVNWLGEWGCSRYFGMGTRIPWAEEYLIESLSDSTVYMAYYTVAHLLQGDIFGVENTGPLGISADDMTFDAWQFVFKGAEYNAETMPVSEEKLQKLKDEFMYWYPWDLRTSGKELMQNHLMMSLYHHAAIWKGEVEMQPQGMRVNGHLLLNGEKMSKSTGNFATLEEGIDCFSADVLRFALAESGDTLDNANLVTKNAENMIMKLTTLQNWIEEIQTTINSGEMRDEFTEEYRFEDSAFISSINHCINVTDHNYGQMLYRVVIADGLNGLLDCRNLYRKRIPDVKNWNKHIISAFIKAYLVCLSPLCPHICDHIWRFCLNQEGSIINSEWPEPLFPEYSSETIHLQSEYLEYLCTTIRSNADATNNSRKKQAKKKNADFEKVSKVLIAVNVQAPQVRIDAIEYMRSVEDITDPSLKRTIGAFLKTKGYNKKSINKAMSFIIQTINNGTTSDFVAESPLDEVGFIHEKMEYIIDNTGFDDITIVTPQDEEIPVALQKNIGRAVPMAPVVVLE
ncbi:hypothetical protein PCE1_001140 [Barthelona sp. PCE]